MIRRLLVATQAALLAATIGACRRHDAPDHDHSHGNEHAREATAEPEPIAITRWTDRYELFVEFPPPEPGKAVDFHAHVTRLEGFQAVAQGRFAVRFKSGSATVAEASVEKLKRPGIFAPELTAPAAGPYQLEMVYEAQGKRDVFDCGKVEVGAARADHEGTGAGLSLRKEQQWAIPFATAWARKQPLARELELPAIVEPAGGQQLTVGAPTAGRFFHNPKLELAEGRRIAKGDVIGFVAPSVGGEDYGRLQLSLDEAQIDQQRVKREIARVQPLVDQGLLPERRLSELRAELESHDARLRAARTRIGRVVAPSSAGGVPIKSALAGVVAQVLVPNGEPVEAGAALARIGGTDHVWVRARFVAKPPSELLNARPTAARLPNGQRIELEAPRARLLSAVPVVDAASRIATWIVDVAPAAENKGADKPPSELVVGSSVVLQLAIGAPRTVLALPRSAVVEINTRPFVFVQTEGETFEKRSVQIGTASGQLIEIEKGIAENERIVTLGGFDIHLASLVDSVESHRH